MKKNLLSSWDHWHWTNRNLPTCSLRQTCTHTLLTPDVWNSEALRPQVERHADTQQKSKQHDCLIQLIQFSPNWSKFRGVSGSGPITSNQQGDCDLEFHSTAHANLCSENQLERPFAFWSIITDNNSEPNNAGVRRGGETVLLLNNPGCIFTPLHGKCWSDEVQVWEHLFGGAL